MQLSALLLIASIGHLSASPKIIGKLNRVRSGDGAPFELLAPFEPLGRVDPQPAPVALMGVASSRRYIRNLKDVLVRPATGRHRPNDVRRIMNIHMISTTTQYRTRTISAPKAASIAFRGWPSNCLSIWITQDCIEG